MEIHVWQGRKEIFQASRYETRSITIFQIQTLNTYVRTILFLKMDFNILSNQHLYTIIIQDRFQLHWYIVLHNLLCTFIFLYMIYLALYALCSYRAAECSWHYKIMAFHVNSCKSKEACLLLSPMNSWQRSFSFRSQFMVISWVYM